MYIAASAKCCLAGKLCVMARLDASPRSASRGFSVRPYRSGFPYDVPSVLPIRHPVTRTIQRHPSLCGPAFREVPSCQDELAHSWQGALCYSCCSTNMEVLTWFCQDPAQICSDHQNLATFRDCIAKVGRWGNQGCLCAWTRIRKEPTRRREPCCHTFVLLGTCWRISSRENEQV